MGLLSAGRREKFQVTRSNKLRQAAIANRHNGFENRRHGCEDVDVPEANHRPAFSDHEFIADNISFAIRMLAAVDFDNKGSLAAGKISEIWANWKLPNEFEAV